MFETKSCQKFYDVDHGFKQINAKQNNQSINILA